MPLLVAGAWSKVRSNSLLSRRLTLSCRARSLSPPALNDVSAVSRAEDDASLEKTQPASAIEGENPTNASRKAQVAMCENLMRMVTYETFPEIQD